MNDEHGTYASYVGGCSCAKCRKACASYMVSYRQRNREYSRLHSAVSQRALWVLVDRHRAEYKAIRDELKASA